jgi:UDP-glucuronate decarboxylase
MKQILITGGAGFLGSHLCAKLLSTGDNTVICMDNFFTGSKNNIDHLLNNNRFELLRHDIIDSFNLEVDELYNMACPASPVHYQYNPVRTIQTSVIGMTNCLDVARRTGARILQASTSEVYGDPEVHPQPESYKGNVNPIGPRACYDEGKRCAETLCYDYKREFKTDIRVVRIFNTYGPNMDPDDGRVVSNFIVQSLRGEDLTIYGDGSQTRSFCYVDDLLDGICKLMASDYSDGPVNIGNPGEFTILQLAELVRAMINPKLNIIFKDLPKDDPTQRRPDISIAKDVLDWKPTIGLEAGLVKTINYFKKII